MLGTRAEPALGSQRQCAGKQCFACATITGRCNNPAVLPPPTPPQHNNSLSARFRSCHFVSLRRLKSRVKGCCYENVPEIQEQLTVLHEPPKSHFQWCFQQWQRCWNRCINSEVNYYEGRRPPLTRVTVYFAIYSVGEHVYAPSYSGNIIKFWNQVTVFPSPDTSGTNTVAAVQVQQPKWHQKSKSVVTIQRTLRTVFSSEPPTKNVHIESL